MRAKDRLIDDEMDLEHGESVQRAASSSKHSEGCSSGRGRREATARAAGAPHRCIKRRTSPLALGQAVLIADGHSWAREMGGGLKPILSLGGLTDFDPVA